MTHRFSHCAAKAAALFLVSVSFAFTLAACSPSEAPDPVEPETESDERVFSFEESPAASLVAEPLSDEAANAVADLGLSILDEVCAGSPSPNVIVSPLSIDYALAMTANGAKGDTLTEMESVLGLSVAEFNEAFGSYRLFLDEQAEYYEGGADATSETDAADEVENDAYAPMPGPLKIANSIWLRDGVGVQDDFLRANNDYYRSTVFGAHFNDATADNINYWVSEVTDGMIERIVDEVPADAVMYLVNALAFDAQWASPYADVFVSDETFTSSTGEVQTVAMMKSEEGRYLETADATGFVKSYAGGDYAFVALLPREGMSVRDFAASLDGAMLRSALENVQYHPVDAWLPRFEFSTDADLSEALAAMGMPTAFDALAADFSGLAVPEDAGGNVFIGRVLHKAYISVMEEGTRAAAATVVEASATSAAPNEDPPEPKVVHLDRPFFFAIVDAASNAPVFIGIVESV